MTPEEIAKAIFAGQTKGRLAPGIWWTATYIEPSYDLDDTGDVHVFRLFVRGLLVGKAVIYSEQWAVQSVGFAMEAAHERAAKWAKAAAKWIDWAREAGL